MVDTTGAVAGSAGISALTSGMWVDDSGNNELSLAILHDHFSNTRLDYALFDHAFEGAGLCVATLMPTFRGGGNMGSVELISRARLFGVQFPASVEVVEVQDGVEDHEIAADGLATIDRVVREEHDMSLSDRDVNDHGALRDVGAAIEKP